MATPDKLFIVHAQDRVVRVQKLGVEDDLDPVVLLVEELSPPDLVQDRIGGVVLHVVGGDRGQRVSLEGKHSSLEQDLVLVRQEALGVGNLGSELSIVPSGVLEQSVSDPVLNLLDRVLQLLDDGLTLEGFDRVRVGGGGHDDKGDDGGLGSHLLQSVVQTCTSCDVLRSVSSRFHAAQLGSDRSLTGQTLEEHVDTLVPVLVPSGGEHVDRVLEVKVVVSVKVTSDELVDLGLGEGVQVLELVHRLELDNVETVGEDSVCMEDKRRCQSLHHYTG